MTDDEREALRPRHLGRYATAVIIGLLCVAVAFLLIINGSTRATNTLLHRGDCRARYQGQYDKDLALLLIEATKPHSDGGELGLLADNANADADHYGKCSNVTSSPNLPRVTVSDGGVSVATTTSTSAPRRGPAGPPSSGG